MIEETTRCVSCGGKVLDISDDQRFPCPSCGSLGRAYGVHSTELPIEVHESLKGKIKDPTKTRRRKVRVEFRTGDDFHRKTGQWNKVDRDIDRENDRYREVVVDGKTGKVIRAVDEPLSAHRGRGSAKKP
jgi:hypothetical protein